MFTRSILRGSIFTITIFSLASCNNSFNATSQNDVAVAPTPLRTLHPEDLPMSPADKSKLVKIAEASDVCPSYLCPVGTKLYLRNGILMGKVVESSPNMLFPSGTRKPGMTTVRPRQTPPLPIQQEVDASFAQTIYVLNP